MMAECAWVDPVGIFRSEQIHVKYSYLHDPPISFQSEDPILLGLTLTCPPQHVPCSHQYGNVHNSLQDQLPDPHR